MKPWLSGAALMFLTMFVAGCATSEPVTRTVTEYREPPAALFPDCEVPQHDIRNNRDLANAYKDLQLRLRECDENLEVLKRWRDAAP